MAASTLLPTLMIVALVLSFVSVAGYITSQFGRFAARQQGASDTLAAADAALEYAYSSWRAAAGSKRSAPTADKLTGITASGFTAAYPVFASKGITIKSLQMQLWNANTGVSPSQLTPVSTQNVPGYPGWMGYTYTYRVDVTASTTDSNGKNSRLGNPGDVNLTRYFQMTQVPLFQAAIFYQNRLEIHPGDDMKVNGLVHSNSSVEAQGFKGLTFNTNVSHVSGFSSKTDHTAAPYGWDGYGYQQYPTDSNAVTWAGGGIGTQLNQVSAIDPFGGATKTNNGLHDIIELPPTSGTDPIADLRMYNNSGLIITVDSSKLPTDANYITVAGGQGVKPSNADVANIVSALTVPLVGTTTFTDLREATGIRATNVDMAKLNSATAGLGSKFNGVIYIHDVAPTVTSGVNGVNISGKPAIRLTNGRSMPNSTTLVSDNAVYIQGDFNTGGMQATDVPSNKGNPNNTANTFAAGYTPSSCAVMADAVTVLSNSWVDGQSTTSINTGAYSGSRLAAPTTLNTAILAGDVPTNYDAATGKFGSSTDAPNGNRTASGGVQNFARFLENWRGIDFTYRGSLVEAFVSEKFASKWQTANVYYWPNREWSFDTNFILNPPPGTPGGLQYSRGRWERY